MKKKYTIFVFAVFLVLFFFSCEKDKVEIRRVNTTDRFDYGTPYGKHMIRETLVYPDGLIVDSKVRWDSCKLVMIYNKSDSANLNCLFTYNGENVSEITIKEGMDALTYSVKYRDNKLYSVICRIGREEYGMILGLKNDMSSINVLSGLTSTNYSLTWENGNLVKIAHFNSYTEFQYDNNPTVALDIPSAFYFLGDVENLVHLSVNNVVSAIKHSSDGDDTVYFTYNYSSDGYPISADASDGTKCYYLYADGDGSTYSNHKKNKVVGGSTTNPHIGPCSSVLSFIYGKKIN